MPPVLPRIDKALVAAVIAASGIVLFGCGEAIAKDGPELLELLNGDRVAFLGNSFFDPWITVRSFEEGLRR